MHSSVPAFKDLLALGRKDGNSNQQLPPAETSPKTRNQNPTKDKDPKLEKSWVFRKPTTLNPESQPYTPDPINKK